jgi:HK97 family phage prohead protease
MKIKTRMMLGHVVKSDETEDDGAFTTFLASTAGEDRAKDIVEQTWELDAWKGNPVIQWAHDYSMLPVGKGVGVEVTDAGLKIRVQWDTGSELGRDIARKYDEGYLSAVSVGFRPGGDSVRRSQLPEGDARKSEHGYLFRNNELLELSAVSVPMNNQALAERGYAVLETTDPVEVLRSIIDDDEANPGAVKVEVLRLLREDADVRRAVGSLAWSEGVESDEPPTLADWLDS